MAHLQVCHVINSLTHGGAEHLLIDLAEEMDSVDITVIYFGGNEDLVPQLRAVGVTVKRLNEYTRFDPIAGVRLWHFLRSNDFDIVHAHLPYAQTISRLTARAAGETPVVSTQHNVPSNYHPVVRLTERVTRRLDDATVAVSQGVERAFTGQAHQPGSIGDRWSTIYNGIDVQEFNQRVKEADGEAIRSELGIKSDATLLLSVGRYVPQKGQTALIEGFECSPNENTDLVLVGHGPLESALRETAVQVGVEEQTHVTGRVPEVESYYAAADAFVSASRGEGLPVTLLEAMAAELPVVASDIPGTREVVSSGETGLLYPQGSPEELADALARLDSPEQRQRWGTKGHQRAIELFDITRMATEYLRLYEFLLQNYNGSE